MSLSLGCTLCPRRCGANRSVRLGFCGAGENIRIARAMPHFWEEPCISGSRGSGAIFFSGCTLGCIYCQNRAISHGRFGKDISAELFAEICFELKEKGVHNLNLVTPDGYIALIAPLLREIKPKLGLPIVVNCGGYLSSVQLALLKGVADVYLPDFKYADADLAQKLSGAGDYPAVAEDAISEMVRQVGKPVLNGDGLLQKGVLVRHLVLPGYRKNSLEVIERLRKHFAPNELLVSLMAQYTPPDGASELSGFGKSLTRRLTAFEYTSVAGALSESGFDGYLQERESAKSGYTPHFGLEGVVRKGSGSLS